jgi:hypothetical protein
MRGGRLSIVLVITALLGGCASAPTSTPNPSPAYQSRVHCGWSGEAKAWADKNENGAWDEGEPGLAGVPIWATVIGSFASTGSSKRTTDANGRIQLSLGPMDCPVGEVVLYAGTPAGYSLTTAASIHVMADGKGAFLFGFAREQHAGATPTTSPYTRPVGR